MGRSKLAAAQEKIAAAEAEEAQGSEGASEADIASSESALEAEPQTSDVPETADQDAEAEVEPPASNEAPSAEEKEEVVETPAPKQEGDSPAFGKGFQEKFGGRTNSEHDPKKQEQDSDIVVVSRDRTFLKEEEERFRAGSIRLKGEAEVRNVDISSIEDGVDDGFVPAIVLKNWECEMFKKKYNLKRNDVLPLRKDVFDVLSKANVVRSFNLG